MDIDLIPINLQLFADGGEPDAGDNTGGTQEPDTGGDGGDGTQDNGKAFTQADIDRILQQRLARERKQWETQMEEERKKAQMSVEERLKAEKEEAEARAQEAHNTANQRLISAEAKVQAVALGVKPERVEYALRLADLSDVDMDDDGNPDAAAIKAALDVVLNDLPELKGTTNPGRSGSEFHGGGQDERNPWGKEHFNLTEQGRIMRADPERAKRLQATARK